MIGGKLPGGIEIGLSQHFHKMGGGGEVISDLPDTLGDFHNDQILSINMSKICNPFIIIQSQHLALL